MDSDGAVISAGLSVCLACNVGSYSSVTGKTLYCNHFWFHDMIPDRLAVSERVASLNQRITRGDSLSPALAQVLLKSYAASFVFVVIQRRIYWQEEPQPLPCERRDPMMASFLAIFVVQDRPSVLLAAPVHTRAPLVRKSVLVSNQLFRLLNQCTSDLFPVAESRRFDYAVVNFSASMSSAFWRWCLKACKLAD